MKHDCSHSITEHMVVTSMLQELPKIMLSPADNELVICISNSNVSQTVLLILFVNKKVLLRERKRHTVRRVTSARYGGGGVSPSSPGQRRGTSSSPGSGWGGGGGVYPSSPGWSDTQFSPGQGGTPSSPEWGRGEGTPPGTGIGCKGRFEASSLVSSLWSQIASCGGYPLASGPMSLYSIWSHILSNIPSQIGVSLRQDRVPPARTGVPPALPHRIRTVVQHGWYASCIHTRELSCFMIIFTGRSKYCTC